MGRPLGGKVGSVGLVWRLEIAEMLPTTVQANRSIERASQFGTLEVNAKRQSTLLAAQWLPNVLRVHCPINRAQVVPSVVQLHPVYMVNLIGWPFACHVQDCQAMGPVSMPHDGDSPVSHFASTASGLASVARVPDSSASPVSIKHRNWAVSPGEMAGGRGVVQQVPKLRSSKIGLSHEAVLSLIGQRPARVGSTQRASPLWTGCVTSSRP